MRALQAGGGGARAEIRSGPASELTGYRFSRRTGTFRKLSIGGVEIGPTAAFEPAGCDVPSGGGLQMDNWKQTFLDKLTQAQSQWLTRFDEALDTHFVPIFEEYRQFLADNGFRLSMPMREPGRRSFKFELSENAYLLMILRAIGVGELELRCDSFVPGCDPAHSRSVGLVSQVTQEWVTERLRGALETFVELLSQASPPNVSEPVEELVSA